MNFEIGQFIRATPTIGADWRSEASKSFQGEVVYIHPQGRFVVLEFTFREGKVREAYQVSHFQPKSDYHYIPRERYPKYRE